MARNIVRLAKEFVLTYNGTIISRCRDFSMNFGDTKIDITSFDSDSFEEHFRGNRNWSISFGSMDTKENGLMDMFDLWVSNIADLPIEIIIGDGHENLIGRGTITLDVQGSMGDVINYSGTITGSGGINKYQQSVEYTATGAITEIDPDTITYSDGYFYYPTGTTSFTFKDDGVDMSAIYDGEAWTITSAAVYYVSNTGSDANDGLSEVNAIKTVSKVNTLVLEPGDTVKFNRGDTWIDDPLAIPYSGLANARITYDAYGTGAKPIITGIIEVPGWETSTNWTDDGANTWGMVYESSPNYSRRVWLDNVEEGASETGVLGKCTAEYPWQYYNEPNAVLYIYSTTNPATAFTSIKMSNKWEMAWSNVDYITIKNIDIQGWKKISISNCQRWIIEYCDWGYGNKENGLEITGASSDGIIRHCNFDSGFRIARVKNTAAYSVQYACDDGIMIRGNCLDWEIHDNDLKAWGHNDIDLLAELGEKSEGIKIHDNYFSHEWGDYGRPFGAQSRAIADCNVNNPNEFYNNDVYHVAAPIQIGQPFLKMYNNVINGHSDQLTIDYTLKLILIGTYSDIYAYRMKVYNNTIVNSKGTAFTWAQAPAHPNAAEECEIVNNIIYETSRRYVRTDTSDTAKILNNLYKNNLFYNASTAYRTLKIFTTEWELLTVAEFNALVEDDAIDNPQNWITSGNIESDPLFTDAATGDFTLATGSPAIGAGLTPLSLRDHNGDLWGDPPALGAYKY